MDSFIPLRAIPFGPGSKTEEDTLSYLKMPSEMHTFEVPPLPEKDSLDEAPEALALLEALQAALDGFRPGDAARVLPLAVPEAALALLYQILGEGEVAVQVYGERPARIQETVLAGVWWIQQLDRQGGTARQWLEVAEIPARVPADAFAGARWPDVAAVPAGLQNAGPVLVALLDVARRHAEAPLATPHVINLSLLPFSPQDHQYLAAQLGEGPVQVLSRGYGNCRIGSTATPGIWRVQYYNSSDSLILDTLEVTGVPQVACAAREDLEDSAERLREIREVLA